LFAVAAACRHIEISSTPSCVLNNKCREYRDPSSKEVLVEAEQTCVDAADYWVEDGCPRAEMAGGCSARVTSPSGTVTVIDWYYARGGFTTAADVMALCAAAGKTYVAP
jgi:hypothetical protein